MLRSVLALAAVAAIVAPTTAYTLQEFTLEEAQTRIERLEARVSELESRGSVNVTVSTPTVGTHRISGSLFLEGSKNYENAGIFNAKDVPCSGEGGFRNFTGSLPVTVHNGLGEVIAGVPLGDGKTTGSNSCEFRFDVEVPDSDYYEIRIAGRGGPLFSRTDLEDQNWVVKLYLGE